MTKKTNRGSYTVEVAILMPIILAFIAFSLEITLIVYNDLSTYLKKDINSISYERNPKEVINNVDIVKEVIEDIMPSSSPKASSK